MTGDDKGDLFEKPDDAYGGSDSYTQTLNQQIQQCATNANNSLPGKGSVVGSQKHTAFKNAINFWGNRYLKTEVSYKNGEIVAYGTKGSVRFDLIEVDSQGKPVRAWDFKTGSAKLTESRIQFMQDISGLRIPINEIR